MPEVVDPIQSTGVSKPATAAPAPATPNAANAEPQTGKPAVTVEEFRKVEGMAYKLERLMEGVTAKLTSLQPAAAPAQAAPKSPAGVEERLDKLTSELEQERAARKEEKLQIAIMSAAGKAGVAQDRVDYLDYKLRKAHGAALTSAGIPDQSNPAAKVSIETLVTSLLSTSEGAVFKAAPQTAAIPAANAQKAAGQDALPKFTSAQFNGGEIPAEIRKSGRYVLVD
jgi:hypothetical protein